MTDETFVDGSAQITELIAVAATMVRFCVAVNVDCACDIAVMVTTLFVGTEAGAVYNPPLVMAPVPDPLTDQFTRVLLMFTTVAVHCEVPSTVTSIGTHEIVIVGTTAVVLEPQELRIASATINPKQRRTRRQATASRPDR